MGLMIYVGRCQYLCRSGQKYAKHETNPPRDSLASIFVFILTIEVYKSLWKLYKFIH